MSSKFRSKIWDPQLIISQIISMQFQFYSSLLLLNYVLHLAVLVYNNNVSDETNFYSLSHIFDYNHLNFKNRTNTLITFSFILNSVIGSLYQWKIVNRSKQCLDFTLTLYFYHILFSCLYMGAFPTRFIFWSIMLVSVIIMTMISEHFCMRSALREIPLSLVPKADL